MLFRSWGCFVLLFIGLAEYLIAQEKSPRFQHLTIENGLPQNRVDCILKDSQGFMWFGTWNGLCRYDGYKIEIFNKESGNTNALRNNFIYVLDEDHFGNIWVGTKEGLYVYLYNRHEFRHVASLSEDSTDAVNSIEQPRAVSPMEESVRVRGNKLNLNIAPYSLSVVKLKMR